LVREDKREHKAKARTFQFASSLLRMVGKLVTREGVLGTTERETARKAMRSWREPRATVLNLAFFRAQHMKMGRMSSVCQSSVVIKSDSVSLAGISERGHIG
jgi:hypothetical protein